MSSGERIVGVQQVLMLEGHSKESDDDNNNGNACVARRFLFGQMIPVVIGDLRFGGY